VGNIDTASSRIEGDVIEALGFTRGRPQRYVFNR
jgi:hypothetical protein